MVRYGFAETLIDLREKYPELIELWHDHGPVVAIRDAGEWEFYAQVEARTFDEFVESVLDAQIMSEESARDEVKRSPDDPIAKLLARYVSGAAEDESDVQTLSSAGPAVKSASISGTGSARSVGGEYARYVCRSSARDR
jgi:hypothetical protein